MPFVYCATNRINGRKYIGISKGKPEARWLRHCRAAATKPRFRDYPPLQKAIRKYSKRVFKLETLYEAVDWLEACKVERGLIAQYGTLVPNGYNLTAGGEGTLGLKVWAGKRHTPETKAKMSAWQIGKKLSEETKQKIAAKAKGRKKKPEHVEAMRGRLFTEEHRAKIRASLKGREFTPEWRAKITEGLHRRWARWHAEREASRAIHG